MKISRILKTLFVLLLIVIFVEIGYYLYISSSFNSNKDTISVNSIPIPTPTPFPVAAQLNYKNSRIEEMLSNINYVKNGTLTSYDITRIWQGEITELDTNKNKLPGKETEYNLKITLKRNNDIKTRYYTSANVDRLKVVKMEKNIEVPISLNDLRVNDNILIKEIQYFLSFDEKILNEFKITKI